VRIFHSFEEFMARVAPVGLSKKALELLIKVGAFDCLNPHRKSLVEQQLHKFYSKYDKNNATQRTLFEFDELIDEPMIEDYLWSEKIGAEEHLLGFAMSGMLLDPYLNIKQSFWQKNYQLGEQHHKPTLVLVHGLRDIITSKGTKFIIVQLMLQSAGIEVILNPTKERDQPVLEQLKALSESRKPALALFKTVEGRNKKSLITLVSIVALDDFLIKNVTKVRLEASASNENQALKLFFKGVSLTQYPCLVEIYLYDEQDKERKPLIFILDGQGYKIELSNLIEKTYTFKEQLMFYLE
jgi:DNA polymerase III alpha subunit